VIQSKLLHSGVGSIKRLGGGTGFQGHFWILKRAPKKIFPEMLATGGVGGEETFSRHTIPRLHVFDQIVFKNMEISKQKGHL
jgi:hypothetical protein